MANGWKEYGPRTARLFSQVLDWKGRERVHGGFFSEVIDCYKIKKHSKVLDMATGTGLDTAIFLKKGHFVTGVDGSPEMLKMAKMNLESRWLAHKPYVLIRTEWKSLRNQFVPGQFDVCVCMGNSLSQERNRSRIISQVRELLRPNGVFILEYRNFDKLLSQVLNGQSTFPTAGYFDPGITAMYRYNKIMGRIKATYTKDGEALFSLSYYPVSRAKAESELRKNGFSVKIYSDYREGLNPDAFMHQFVGKAI